MTTANLETTAIQVEYGLKLDTIEKSIKTALENAAFAKNQKAWVFYAHWLQVAATAAENLVTLQVASDAFDAKLVS